MMIFFVFFPARQSALHLPHAVQGHEPIVEALLSQVAAFGWSAMPASSVGGGPYSGFRGLWGVGWLYQERNIARGSPCGLHVKVYGLSHRQYSTVRVEVHEHAVHGVESLTAGSCRPKEVKVAAAVTHPVHISTLF